MLKSPKQNIYLRDGEKPSRFLLNLNQAPKQEQPPKPTIESVYNAYESVPKEINNREFLYNEILERLAFYPVIKAVIFVFVKSAFFSYQICYFIGNNTVRSIKLAGTGAGQVLKLAKRTTPKLHSAGDMREGKIFYDDEVAAIFNPKLTIEKETTAGKLMTRDKKLYGRSEEAVSSEPARRREIKINWRAAVPEFSIEYFRSVMVFSAILMLIALPFKSLTIVRGVIDLRGKVLGASEAAIGQIAEAKDSIVNKDLDAAGRNFESAELNFQSAKKQINDLSVILGVLSAIVPNENIKLAAASGQVLEAGRISSLLGMELTAAMAEFSSPEKGDTAAMLEKLEAHYRTIDGYVQQLNSILEKINPEEIPAEYGEKLAAARTLSGLLSQSSAKMLAIVGMAKEIAGIDYDKRYLFVFQNNNELRASGGFIGSYAIVDVSRGRIKKMEAPGGGSYDTEAGLIEKIVAPEPLHLVNPLWHFWDSNWWPDWPTTAKKLMQFLEKSDGPSVDGVISLTPTAFEGLLRAIGPVDMQADYGVTITADNFWEIVQDLSEQKPDVTKKPKKIIGDLMDKIVNELPQRLNQEAYLNLAAALEDNLKQKQMMFYFKDKEAQAKVIEFGWGGNILETGKDYLMVVNSNIAGGKSDRKIIEDIEHTASLENDGTIIDTVRIKRQHTAGKDEKYTGVRNVDWMRVYVPLGSELLSARGFSEPGGWFFSKPEENWLKDPDVAAEEASMKTDPASGTKIYNEAGKTVFANWSMIDTGETAEVLLRYKLPFKYTDNLPADMINRIGELLNGRIELSSYSLLVQKQPGSIGSGFSGNVVMPQGNHIVWQYPGDANFGGTINDVIREDKYYAFVLEKHE